MIVEVLEYIGKEILRISSDFAIPFANGFTAVDFGDNGVYHTKDFTELDFNERFGNHFYQRVAGDVGMDSTFLTSSAKTYTMAIPVRMVGFLNKNSSGIEPSEMAERTAWVLSRIESESFKKAVNRYTIEIESLVIDKRKVVDQETQTESLFDLQNVVIFAVDYTLTIQSNLNICRVTDCCVI